MSDEAAIRRTNLRALCKRREWSIKDLAARLTWARYTYWRDLLDDESKKSFGEKVARRIEESLELGRGWLDEPNGGTAHRYPRASAPPPPPGTDFTDRHLVSESDWALLQDFKTAATPEEVAAIRARAAAVKIRVDELVAERLASATPTKKR